MKQIHYAFGRDYLKSWDIKDALREIFQNYIDYGPYNLSVKDTPNPDFVNVTIYNDYDPSSLEFLRLGNTSKDDGKSIGHHGEGLKAAFLIFNREDLYFAINTRRHRLIGGFDNDEAIGETFHITYTDTGNNIGRFITVFHCPKKEYEEFVSNILTEDDILHSHDYYGDLLKPSIGKGKIYSGNLFVAEVKGLNYSYNIKPEHLRLDRDRRAPSDWDVEYATSYILKSYKEEMEEVLNEEHSYNSKEYSFGVKLTETEVSNIKAVKADDTIQYFDTVNKEVITNKQVINVLEKHPKFKKVITLSKREKFVQARIAAKRKSVPVLLKSFKAKYCSKNEDMIVDINVIIDKVNKKDARK